MQLSTHDIAELRAKIKEPLPYATRGLIVYVGMEAVFAIAALAFWLGARCNILLPFKGFLIGSAVWTLVFALLGLYTWLRGARMRKFAATMGFNYVNNPLKIDLFDLSVGSVIDISGTTSVGYGSLLHGSRHGYSFRAIDSAYSRGAKDAYGQTIFCIDMQTKALIPFAILASDYLIRRTQKTISASYTQSVPDGCAVTVEPDSRSHLLIPTSFLALYPTSKSFTTPFLNVEYLGDRLLVYSLRKSFIGNEFLDCLDYAIQLAKTLE